MIDLRKSAIICDLDGTLCDLRHRLHFMAERPKRRDEFHAAAKDDAVWPDVHRYLRLTKAAGPWAPLTILVTCRPEKYRADTEAWLLANGVRYDDLIMRQDGDTREDALIKSLIYHYHIEPYYQVLCVLEDKRSVVKMWRDLGLNCWQVRDYDA